MLRKKASIIILAIISLPLTAGLNVAGCAGKGIPGVEVGESVKGEVSARVSATGKLEASEAVDVLPVSSGAIGQLLVSDGDEVEAGEVLAVLEQGSLEAQREQARSNYLTTASTGDMMSGMWGNSVLSYQTMASSMLSLEAMQTETNSFIMAFLELAPVFASFLPPEQQQQAQEVIKRQKAEYEEAVRNREPITVLPASGYPSSAAAADAARTALADKEYRRAQAGANDPTLKAPISGAVVFVPPPSLVPQGFIDDLNSSLGGLASSLGAFGGGSSLGGGLGGMLSALSPSAEIREGTQVQAGQPVFQVIDLQNMRVKAEVEESDIPRVKKGQPVTIMLDAYPEKRFTGRVVQVGAKGQSGSSGTTVFPVTIQMDRSDIPLRIGYNALVDIEVNKAEGVVVVPAAALVRYGSDSFVYVVVNGVAERREVVPGLENEELVEVREGLEEGERVVVEGTSKVKPGSRL